MASPPHGCEQDPAPRHKAPARSRNPRPTPAAATDLPAYPPLSWDGPRLAAAIRPSPWPPPCSRDRPPRLRPLAGTGLARDSGPRTSRPRSYSYLIRRSRSQRMICPPPQRGGQPLHPPSSTPPGSRGVASSAATSASPKRGGQPPFPRHRPRPRAAAESLHPPRHRLTRARGGQPPHSHHRPRPGRPRQRQEAADGFIPPAAGRSTPASPPSSAPRTAAEPPGPPRGGPPPRRSPEVQNRGWKLVETFGVQKGVSRFRVLNI